MGLRRQRKHFTIMVIPHSERAVVTFRLPIGVLQVLACCVAVFWVGVLVFVTSYFRVLSLTPELSELRWINREQRVQIQALIRETASLRDRFAGIVDLERQVRELAQIDEVELPSDSETRLLRLEQAQEQRVVGTGLGGAASETFSVAGIVSRQPLEQAYAARAELTGMSDEMDLRRDAMHNIKEVLIEQQLYLAARPSTWPTLGIISSGFGYRRSPFGWGREMHNGIDIAARHRTPITAPGGGTVTFGGWKANYGYTLMIDHGYGFTTQYSHCSRLAVAVGDEVVRGQVIAFVGSTGRSTGPHLHYEVHVDGRPVDPKPYLVPPSRD